MQKKPYQPDSNSNLEKPGNFIGKFSSNFVFAAAINNILLPSDNISGNTRLHFKDLVKPEDIISKFLKKLESEHNGLRFSIQILNAYGNKIVNCIAPTLPTAFKLAFNDLLLSEEATICAFAATKRKPVIIENIRYAAIEKKWREHYLNNEILACYAFPVKSADKVFGIFSCYNKNPEPPSEKLMHSVEKICQLVGILLNKKQ